MTTPTKSFDERFNELPWNEAVFIRDAHKYAEQAPGTYVVLYSNSTNGYENSGVQYSFGINSDGVIYIGESTSLQDRLGRLSWIIDKNANVHRHHDMISTYYDFQYFSRFDSRRMYILFFATESHKDVEAELLNLFKIQYGNYPIFNLRG